MRQVPESPIDPVKFALRTSKGVHFISYTDVTYCEADGRYTHVHIYDADTIIVAKLLKEFEDKLPKDYFFRIHKSYIVNLDYVTGFDISSKNYVIINKTKKLSIARRKRKIFNQRLSNKVVYI